jgi:hypothetical protein
MWFCWRCHHVRGVLCCGRARGRGAGCRKGRGAGAGALCGSHSDPSLAPTVGAQRRRSAGIVPAYATILPSYVLSLADRAFARAISPAREFLRLDQLSGGWVRLREQKGAASASGHGPDEVRGRCVAVLVPCQDDGERRPGVVGRTPRASVSPLGVSVSGERFRPLYSVLWPWCPGRCP